MNFVCNVSWITFLEAHTNLNKVKLIQALELMNWTNSCEGKKEVNQKNMLPLDHQPVFLISDTNRMRCSSCHWNYSICWNPVIVKVLSIHLMLTSVILCLLFWLCFFFCVIIKMFYLRMTQAQTLAEALICPKMVM